MPLCLIAEASFDGIVAWWYYVIQTPEVLTLLDSTVHNYKWSQSISAACLSLACIKINVFFGNEGLLHNSTVTYRK